MNPRAEAVRIRYKYRRMVIRGDIKVPHEVAVKLVGPDCAYHLYQQYQGGSTFAKASASAKASADESEDKGRRPFDQAQGRQKGEGNKERKT
jgi:hypothetical protein